ncbi:DUF4160 domain-containing protein [Terriglobus aquaticus]|uniref:DUF4160 domain-containing protein n=2 Tax=Terriglobus aquaticus TaxID=940139 RepID=A0ABW9KHP6_9BACT
MIYTDDHGPPHVHATDGSQSASFWLHCAERRASLRARKHMAGQVLSRVQNFIEANVEVLCEAWKEVHQ